MIEGWAHGRKFPAIPRNFGTLLVVSFQKMVLLEIIAGRDLRKTAMPADIGGERVLWGRCEEPCWMQSVRRVWERRTWGYSNIDYMLALIATHIVGACAGWFKTNDNIIQVPCCTSHDNQLFRNLISASRSAFNDKHPALKLSSAAWWCGRSGSTVARLLVRALQEMKPEGPSWEFSISSLQIWRDLSSISSLLEGPLRPPNPDGT